MKQSEKMMDWIKRIFWICCVVVVIRILFIPFQTTGSSMSPTIQSNDALIMTRFGHVKRFDIVVFETDNNERYIKRVIGLPGDQLAYKNDKLYINHRYVNEPFLKENQHKFKKDDPSIAYTSNFDLEQLFGIQKIPDNFYFVMGDNRRFSKDSRSFGLIAKQQLIGKVRLVYYPFSQIKLL